jgi:uncharacterized repeat protein (TIGR02543 family)
MSIFNGEPRLQTAIKGVVLLGILLLLSFNPPNPTSIVRADDSQSPFGFSGYPLSTSAVQNVIDVMDANGLSIYRMSFNPEWFSSKPRPYNSSYIQYFLDNSDCMVIVDRNHLYPPSGRSASKARKNWDTVRNSVFEVLETWPNNPRVAVELINEYVSNDFYDRMQELVDEIREAGYTNPIVVNKWDQRWTKINDPLENTFQGYHFYFNYWSVAGAISQMEIALSRDIKIINTEIGADSREKRYFTEETVDELNTFMNQSANLGVGNCVWMVEDLDNWPTYQSLGMVFPTAPTTPNLHEIALQSEEDDVSTSNLGTITCDSVDYQLPSVSSKEEGAYAVEYSAASGYTFNHWVTSDLVSVADVNTQSTMMTVSGEGGLKAIYTSAPTQFTLHVQINGLGSVNATDYTYYDEGTIVDLTATPDTGYEFIEWSGEATGTAVTTTVTMDANKTVTATFTPIEYDLNVLIEGSGTVSKNPDQATYHYGDTVTLTATPADVTSTFTSWSVDVDSAENPLDIIINGTTTVTATFTNQYVLTVNVEGNGEVTLNPNQLYYADGTDVDLITVADLGWTFSEWNGDLTGSTNPATITMDEDKTVTATFTQDEYTLDVTVVGSGTVTKSPDPATYHYGDVVTLTATPDNENWIFATWSGDAESSDNPLIITITGNALVTATFSNENVLTVNVVGNGHVVLDPSGGTYSDGTSVSLTSVADPGWTFSGWSDALSGSSNPESIVMNDHKTVTATFTEDHYMLTVNNDLGGSVDVNPNLAYYLYGEEVELTAVADPGWMFNGWSFDLTGLINPETITMDDHKTVTATFIQEEYTLTVTPVGSGAVDKSPDQVIYHYNDIVTLTPVADPGWTFNVWSDSASGSDDPLEVTILGDASITATFTQDEYTLTIMEVGSGSVGKFPDQWTYHYDDLVTLTATADPGWTFDSWSDGVTSSENPLELLIKDDINVTATFTQDEYTLTVSTVSSGSVAKDPDQWTYHYGDVVELTATPVGGYLFSGWSGDLTGSTNPDTITIDGDNTVTATFTEIPPPYLFFDDFEENNLDLWDGSDGGAVVSSANPYQGTYHLTCNLRSGANNGWSGVYKRISGTNPLRLGAYVYFNAPPTTNGEDQWVLCLSQNPSGDAVAYAGIHRVDETLYWTIWYRSGTSLTYNVSGSIYSDGWHRLELAVYRGTQNDGWVEFYVDGVMTCSVYDIDNDYRALNYARVGFSYSDAPSSASSTVYIDDVTIDV